MTDILARLQQRPSDVAPFYGQNMEDAAVEIANLRAVRDVAERICQKLEHPTASVTIFDQTDLRAALDAAQRG